VTTRARLPLLLLAALVSFVAGGAEAPWASSARAKPRLGELPTSAPVVPIPDWSVGGITAGSYFGEAVTGAGEVDGDRYADVVVGEPREQYDSAHLGHVHVNRGSGAGLNPLAARDLTDGLIGSHFGWSVAHADVNGDGYSDLIVGAPAAKCQEACRLSRGDVT
jgi:hypothetical protein